MKLDIERLEKKFNININSPELIARAFVHKSYANENEDTPDDNERLEFLGDAVLDLAISSYLFQHFPGKDEGELAKMRAYIVSEPTLAQRAKSLNLGDFLLLGKGEEKTGGRARKSILADTMEAFIGALYLDQNYEIIQQLIQELFQKELAEVLDGDFDRDFKTLLQEYIQQEKDSHPEYRVVSELGPDHNKTFLIEVYVEGRCLGQGQADSKKEAQQKAAGAALKELNFL